MEHHRFPTPWRLRVSLVGAVLILTAGSAALAAGADHSHHGHHAAPGAGVVEGYDALRAALADDDAPRATRAAAALEATARKAGAAFAEVARLASAVAKAPVELEAQRAAFGPLSKALIALVASDATLAKGLVVYRCPMAKGYKKWLEREGVMANPYMGKRMARCGSKVPMAP